MSTSMAHTPGPWRIDIGIINPGTDIRSQDGTMLAQVFGHGVHESEKSANARLIAAAPDLLTTLKEIADSYLTPPAVKARALAAIAHAEGRGV